jgi:HEAT repeat protein
MSSPTEALQHVFDAERTLRSAQHDFFIQGDDATRLAALTSSVDAAWGGAPDPEESIVRLARVAALAGEIGGVGACTLLLRLLNHEEPEVRVPAGESLQELAYSRYAEVARVIEKCIDEGKAETALAEIPYILAEIGEPGGSKLCVKLLKHASGDVVASAVEALANLGDASAIKEIEKLVKDKRKVTLDDDPEAEEVAIGDLASEAIEHLRSLDV